MLHPSYTDLMKVVNSEVEEGDTPVVNSRCSIVMATAKRARQIIGGAEPLVYAAGKKPLSVAVEELNKGKIKILGEDEMADKEENAQAEAALSMSDTSKVSDELEENADSTAEEEVLAEE